MNAKNLIGGFIVGAALGAAAGLLLAPASGEKTRRKIVKGSMKVKKNVVDYVEGSIDALRTQINSKIDQVTGRAKDAVNYAADRADTAAGRAKAAVNYTAESVESAASKARNHG
jgi:gas vesicle protein